ncbi:MAG TPA: hypothetical protein VFC16_06515 [Nakamurella sp.]|nr:hypothetical protein [Nakamurella sp.]
MFSLWVPTRRSLLTDPARERAGDIWDLAVFGHPGRLSFTGISQPWLARAARAWAGEELRTAAAAVAMSTHLGITTIQPAAA